MKKEIIILLLSLSCLQSCKVSNLDKLSNQIERNNSINYAVSKNKSYYKECNEKKRLEFLEAVFKINDADIYVGIESVLLELYENEKVFFALKTNGDIFYYERDNFIDCNSGKLTSTSETNKRFVKITKLVYKDLGVNLNFDNVISKSNKYSLSHSSLIYLTVIKFLKNKKVKIERSINFDEYDDTPY